MVWQEKLLVGVLLAVAAIGIGFVVSDWPPTNPFAGVSIGGADGEENAEPVDEVEEVTTPRPLIEVYESPLSSGCPGLVLFAGGTRSR